MKWSWRERDVGKQKAKERRDKSNSIKRDHCSEDLIVLKNSHKSNKEKVEK